MKAEYVFLNTDIDIALTVSGTDLATATEIKCAFRKIGVADITLSKTGGKISVSSSTSATISIGKTDIVLGGIYEIRLIVTEASGKERGMKLDVTHLVLE